MNSKEIAEGIVKAVMIVAFGIGTFLFFREYPWRHFPVGIVAIVGLIAMMLGEVGMFRTICWLGVLGGTFAVGWGFYSTYMYGKSPEAGTFILVGYMAAVFLGKFDDWLRKRPKSN